MYHNTLFLFKKEWNERKFISHCMAMGYVVKRIDNTPFHVIYGTTKKQQLFIMKWATYYRTC